MWIRESRLAQIAQVPRSTLASWLRGGVLERPEDGVYREHDLLLAVMLRAAAAVAPRPELRHVRRLLEQAGGPGVAARELRGSGEPRVDLVLDHYTGDLVICHDDRTLVRAVRPRAGAGERSVAIVAAGPALARALYAFRNFAETGRPPAATGPGRPRRSSPGLRLVD